MLKVLFYPKISVNLDQYSMIPLVMLSEQRTRVIYKTIKFTLQKII